eukprot:g5684.t1
MPVFSQVIWASSIVALPWAAVATGVGHTSAYVQSENDNNFFDDRRMVLAHDTGVLQRMMSAGGASAGPLEAKGKLAEAAPLYRRALLQSSPASTPSRSVSGSASKSVSSPSQTPSRSVSGSASKSVSSPSRTPSRSGQFSLEICLVPEPDTVAIRLRFSLEILVPEPVATSIRIYCLCAVGPDVGSGSSGTSNQWVTLHNNFRAKWGASPRSLSASLASAAQQYAQNPGSRCEAHLKALIKSFPMSHNTAFEHSLVSGQGENLYMMMGSSAPCPEDGNQCIHKSTAAWASEAQKWTGSENGQPFADIGHFTQMVWKSTTQTLNTVNTVYS